MADDTDTPEAGPPPAGRANFMLGDDPYLLPSPAERDVTYCHNTDGGDGVTGIEVRSLPLSFGSQFDLAAVVERDRPRTTLGASARPPAKRVPGGGYHRQWHPLANDAFAPALTATLEGCGTGWVDGHLLGWGTTNLYYNLTGNRLHSAPGFAWMGRIPMHAADWRGVFAPVTDCVVRRLERVLAGHGGRTPTLVANAGHRYSTCVTDLIDSLIPLVRRGVHRLGIPHTPLPVTRLRLWPTQRADRPLLVEIETQAASLATDRQTDDRWGYAAAPHLAAGRRPPHRHSYFAPLAVPPEFVALFHDGHLDDFYTMIQVPPAEWDAIRLAAAADWLMERNVSPEYAHQFTSPGYVHLFALFGWSNLC